MKILNAVLAVLGVLLALLLLAGLFLTLGNYFSGPYFEEHDAGAPTPAAPAPVACPPAVCPTCTCIPYRKPNYPAPSVVDREVGLAEARGDHECAEALFDVRIALLRDGLEDVDVLLDHMGEVLSPDAGVAP